MDKSDNLSKKPLKNSLSDKSLDDLCKIFGNLKVIRDKCDTQKLPDKGVKLENKIKLVEDEINTRKTDTLAIGNILNIHKVQTHVTDYYKSNREVSKIKVLEIDEKLSSKVCNSDESKKNFNSNKISSIKPLESNNVVKFKKMIQSLENQASSRNSSDNDFVMEFPSITISLMDHQKEALKWMLWRENNEPSGGILADDMGLGKTVTVLSLCAIDYNVDLKSPSNNLIFINSNLIIVPSSLIHNWRNEIINNICSNMKIGIFHGSDKSHLFDKINDYHFIITTYKMITQSTSSRVFQYEWRRLILDEAHCIKNNKSITFNFINKIVARRKWALTGTPVHNKQDDLFSLMSFIGCHYFTEKGFIKICEKFNDFSRFVDLHCETFVLRRTKFQSKSENDKTPIVNLPSKYILCHQFELSSEEYCFYNHFNNLARIILKTFKTNSDIFESLSNFIKDSNESSIEMKEILIDVTKLIFYKKFSTLHNNSESNKSTSRDVSFVLQILLRLQQCCCHLSLLIKDIIMPSDQDCLLVNVSCPLDDITNSMSNLNVSSTNGLKTVNDVEFEKLVKKIKKLPKYEKYFTISSNSSKIDILKKILIEISKEKLSNNEIFKCVIISQWTSFLDILELHLISDYKLLRIDGKSKVESRNEIVDNFNTKKEQNILLLSLKAGGVGFNLVSADHLILMDEHWNPALINQAIDRIYRLGQKRDVTIHRLISNSTIEQRIVNLQQEKMNIFQNLINKKNSISQNSTETKLKIDCNNQYINNLSDIFSKKMNTFDKFNLLIN